LFCSVFKNISSLVNFTKNVPTNVSVPAVRDARGMSRDECIDNCWDGPAYMTDLCIARCPRYRSLEKTTGVALEKTAAEGFEGRKL
jgi:hypothetical protein